MYIITKILVVGSNTLTISKSLKSLGYTVYATSFFKLIDQAVYVDKLIVPGDIDDFNLNTLVDVALDYVNEVDYIICTSDVDLSRFPKSKIIGNKDTNSINDKFKLYKKLYKNFLLPTTYKLNSIDEALEIADASDKKFIVKPINGSGGVNINYFTEDSYIDDTFILQEYIEGRSVSSTFLSYPKDDIDMITTSDQVIGSKRLGASSFLYCGNITPLVNYTDKINNISSKISRMYHLVGCNGIDFVLHDNKVYVIEVNPRIPGTIDTIQESYDFNLIKAHIDSCNNHHVNIPKVKQFAVKLIPYSFNDAYYNLSKNNNVQCISDDNFLIKKGYPICTILTSDRILENAMMKAEIIQKQVYNSMKKISNK